jgi:DnaK suppressor protein
VKPVAKARPSVKANGSKASAKTGKAEKPTPKPEAKSEAKPTVNKVPVKAAAGKVPASNAKVLPSKALPPKASPPKVPAVRVKLTPFLEKQKDRLLQLRDSLLDSMTGVAKDTLRARAEGSEASAFGMHQADAGSDAYDRDFALSLLSQEQDALYEIEEALKRVDAGTYGVCEMSGEKIAQARLEALPFARYTVECQAQIEKQRRINRSRTPVTSLFGLTDDDSDDGDEEETPTTTETKDDKE